MDRRAVTSPGVVKISRLASRLRRPARTSPDPTAVLIKLLVYVLSVLNAPCSEHHDAVNDCSHRESVEHSNYFHLDRIRFPYLGSCVFFSSMNKDFSSG